MTEQRFLRALTVRQPWASAIVDGPKAIENRTWRPPIPILGRYIAIHAGMRTDDAEAFAFCAVRGFRAARAGATEPVRLGSTRTPKRGNMSGPRETVFTTETRLDVAVLPGRTPEEKSRAFLCINGDVFVLSARDVLRLATALREALPESEDFAAASLPGARRTAFAPAHALARAAARLRPADRRTDEVGRAR